MFRLLKVRKAPAIVLFHLELVILRKPPRNDVIWPLLKKSVLVPPADSFEEIKFSVRICVPYHPNYLNCTGMGPHRERFFDGHGISRRAKTFRIVPEAYEDVLIMYSVEVDISGIKKVEFVTGVHVNLRFWSRI